MILMAEAKPNMRCEGLFFRGRSQYTIFLHSQPENVNFRLAQRPEIWHFLALVQKMDFYREWSEISTRQKYVRNPKFSCLQYYWMGKGVRATKRPPKTGKSNNIMS